MVSFYFSLHQLSNCFFIRIVVALAIERLVAIKYPLWSKYICSVTNARRIIYLILVFTMMIQSYHFITKGLDCSSSRSTQNCRCKTLRGYARLDIFFTIYIWRLILMTLMPLIIIITVNILIMDKLFNKNSLIDHTNTVDNARRKIILRYKVSRMLVIVSSIYLLLHVPGSSLEIIKFLLIHVFKMCNIKWEYYIHIAQDIFDLLTNLNYGINFYLYIISSKQIRRELLNRNSSFHSSTVNHKRRFQRSKSFISSYMCSTKNNQRSDFNVKLAQCDTISSI